jgi:hypothetical protein
VHQLRRGGKHWTEDRRALSRALDTLRRLYEGRVLPLEQRTEGPPRGFE